MTSITSSLTRALADRYSLDRELGRGGMATVYLARDVRHARQVAIKVLHPEPAAVLGTERFLAEITTTANTPQYMAPEQAMGEKSIEARADIGRGIRDVEGTQRRGVQLGAVAPPSPRKERHHRIARRAIPAHPQRAPA